MRTYHDGVKDAAYVIHKKLNEIADKTRDPDYAEDIGHLLRIIHTELQTLCIKPTPEENKE